LGSDREGSSSAELATLTTEAEQHKEAPFRLWRLLDGALRDTDRFDELVARSVYHANGFVRIVLVPEGSPRLRLHVWPRGDERMEGTDHPHGHRWAFASWVIMGLLREVTFVEGRGGVPFREYRYAGSDEELPDVPLTRVLLTTATTSIRSSGQVYTRQPGEVHVAVPATDDLVATLVIQGEDVMTTTPVYRKTGDRRPQPNLPIGPAELRALLVEVLGVLVPVP
jgi:hypothetical protein